MRARPLVAALLPLALTGPDWRATPYLPGAPALDLTQVLPAPPSADDPRRADDRATFAATRTLAGTDRWRLATSDATVDRFTVFACAIGRRLDAQSAPALARLFTGMGDGGAVDRAKSAFAVRRPYLDQPGPICEPRTAHLAANGDYPSGHTSNGWATALVLAELMPARATAILRRGREYGESRYLCGSHSRSAVEAGYIAGAAIVSQWHASAAFRRDMDRARAELERLMRASPVAAPSCPGR